MEASQPAPRDIVISNPDFEYGNVEAWMNIIKSYEQIHPEHEVIILYEGEVVSNMISLFKMETRPNRSSFQMTVNAPDGNWKDMAKLYRLLVEGASPNFQKFIGKEVYRVLKLF